MLVALAVVEERPLARGVEDMRLGDVAPSACAVSATSSRIWSAARASPPARLATRSTRSSAISTSSSSAPRRTICDSSSSESATSSITVQRESSAELTSKYGFSVVAPISVTSPSSTACSTESCCALLKRWISSMKRIVRCPFPPRRSRARAMTARTSSTRAETAESSSKTAPVRSATILAIVVLPVPGGPKRIVDGGRSCSIASRRAVPSPSTCSWPTRSSSVRGRKRTASGAPSARRSRAASEKRSPMARSMLRAWPGRVPRKTGIPLARNTGRPRVGPRTTRSRFSRVAQRPTTRDISIRTSCSRCRRARTSGCTATSSCSRSRTSPPSSGSSSRGTTPRRLLGSSRRATCAARCACSSERRSASASSSRSSTCSSACRRGSTRRSAPFSGTARASIRRAGTSCGTCSRGSGRHSTKSAARPG